MFFHKKQISQLPRLVKKVASVDGRAREGWSSRETNLALDTVETTPQAWKDAILMKKVQAIRLDLREIRAFLVLDFGVACSRNSRS